MYVLTVDGVDIEDKVHKYELVRSWRRVIGHVCSLVDPQPLVLIGTQL